MWRNSIYLKSMLFKSWVLLLLSFGVRCARIGESENTLSVQRPQPHTTNSWMEEEDKIVGDIKEKVDHANRKALPLLLKPASPTPSNTGWLRSFQRDTERGKVLRYWEVLHLGGANECLWASKAPPVTRVGTYGKGNAPLKGFIGLLLILKSMHNSATDRLQGCSLKHHQLENQNSWRFCPVV